MAGQGGSVPAILMAVAAATFLGGCLDHTLAPEFVEGEITWHFQAEPAGVVSLLPFPWPADMVNEQSGSDGIRVRWGVLAEGPSSTISSAFLQPYVIREDSMELVGRPQILPQLQWVGYHQTASAEVEETAATIDHVQSLFIPDPVAAEVLHGGGFLLAVHGNGPGEFVMQLPRGAYSPGNDHWLTKQYFTTPIQAWPTEPMASVAGVQGAFARLESLSTLGGNRITGLTWAGLSQVTASAHPADESSTAMELSFEASLPSDTFAVAVGKIDGFKVGTFGSGSVDFQAGIGNAECRAHAAYSLLEDRAWPTGFLKLAGMGGLSVKGDMFIDEKAGDATLTIWWLAIAEPLNEWFPQVDDLRVEGSSRNACPSTR